MASPLDAGFADRSVATGFPFGPYINNQVPTNPFNGLRTVKNTDKFDVAADDLTGWVYERTSGRLRLNKTGTIPGDITITYWSL